MNDELTQKKIDAVLAALDDLIESGSWDESNFIKIIGKNIREIRNNFANAVHLPTQEKIKDTSQVATRMALRSGQQEVFIALYSSDGGNIQSWEKILANLPKQIISRPIYNDEDSVKSIIKTKDNKQNEAYVAIYVNQSDILDIPLEKAPLDKLGKPMLSLKDRAIILDNIHYFVSQLGTYKYVKGQLIKNGK